MLEISGSIDEVGSIRPELAAALFCAWMIVFLALLKGVKSFGKVGVVINTIVYYLRDGCRNRMSDDCLPPYGAGRPINLVRIEEVIGKAVNISL